MLIQARSQEAFYPVSLSLPLCNSVKAPDSFSLSHVNQGCANILPQTLDLAWAMAKDHLNK